MARKLNNISSLSRGILSGWMVGTTIGLMIAPDSGKEMRGMIQEKGNQAKERTLGTLLSARQQAEDLARRSSNQASSLTEQGKTLINQQKINLQSAVEGIREGIRTYNQPIGNEMQGSSQPALKKTDLEA